MDLTGFGKFNAQTTSVGDGLVKVSITSLSDLIVNDQGRNEQPMRSQFEFIGSAKTIDGAEKKATKRVLAIADKLKDIGDVRVQVGPPKSQNGAFIVTVSVGIFTPVTAEFAGKGQAGLIRRVETVSQSSSIESAQDKALKKALVALGL